MSKQPCNNLSWTRLDLHTHLLKTTQGAKGIPLCAIAAFEAFKKRVYMSSPIPKETNRIKNFRVELAKCIPKFPNNKDTKLILETKGLPDLLLDYINWASRFVPPRPRLINIESTARNDQRWWLLQEQIELLLNKVQKGEDISPHLSRKVYQHGFTPASSAKDCDADRWADKDFLLNVMGYHHFHLGTKLEGRGHVSRTNEVLFAQVTRQLFTVLAICNHSVFENKKTVSSPISDERKRIWAIFDEVSSRVIPPGTLYIPSVVTLSGHADYHVQLAYDYAYIIGQIDPKLDQLSYVVALYEDAGIKSPICPKLKWDLQFLDLGLLDEEQKLFFSIREGPM